MMKNLFLFIISIMAAQTIFAAGQTVAVLPSEGSLKDEELIFLTNKAQEIAVRVLPQNSFEVFPQEIIIKRLGGANNYVKECKASSCIVDLGKKASVDYVAQCTFGKLGSDFTVTFELYRVRTSALIDKFAETAKNTNGLLAIMEKRIPNGFMKIPGAATRQAKPAETKAAPPPVANCDGETEKAKTIFDRCKRIGKGNRGYGECSEEYNIQKGRALRVCSGTDNISMDTGDNIFTDARDNKKYKTVKIGNQIWMAENLNYDASGSKCHGNNSENCAKYGRLYDWTTAKKVCPSGWHLPSKSEYEVLDEAVGGVMVTGEKLKAKSGWYKNTGTDDYGFSALPGGRGDLRGIFDKDIGDYGGWWSASEYENDRRSAYNRCMDYFYANEQAYWGNLFKSFLLSVRCIKD